MSFKLYESPHPLLRLQKKLNKQRQSKASKATKAVKRKSRKPRISTADNVPCTPANRIRPSLKRDDGKGNLDKNGNLREELRQLKEKLQKTEEKNKYWRRKSIELSSTMKVMTHKNNEKMLKLEEKIEDLVNARFELKAKLTKVKSENEECITQIARMLAEQDRLEAEKVLLEEELHAISTDMPDDDPDQGEQAEYLQDLKDALWDALSELQNRLTELERYKASLARTTKQKNRLEAKLKKKKEDGEDADKDILPKEILTDPVKELEKKERRRIRKIKELSGSIEKLILKCSVLSATNKKLRAMLPESEGSASPTTSKPKNPSINLSEDPDRMKNLALLETMCTKRSADMMNQATSLAAEHQIAVKSPS